MASGYSRYQPLSTIPDVIVDMKGPDKGGYKNISDEVYYYVPHLTKMKKTNFLGYETTIEELKSYLLNRRAFPAMYPAFSFILLLGDPGR